jgi:ATP-dependent exoDNAse (exonuclease V) alpha subunit
LFTLNEGQSKAVEAINQLTKNHPSGGGILVINGPAGSGKSSLLKTIVGENTGMLVLAPTGRASLRVKEVAGCNSSTIHKWIYSIEENLNTGEIEFVRNSLSDLQHPNFHSLIIDEASMLDEEIWNDVYDSAMMMGLNLVLIGDEFQLPPVDNASNFSVFSNSFKCVRINLTEVMRQALDSPILRAANALRTGNYLMELSALPIVMKSEAFVACTETWKQQGVTICHKNETRHLINETVRKDCGRILSVEEGESLMVIKNNYKLNVFNGETFTVNEILNRLGGKIVKDKFKGSSAYVEFLRVNLGTTEAVIAVQQLTGQCSNIGTKALELASAQMINKNGLSKTPFLSCNFGYASTAHKYQGSEIANGIVFIEQMVRPTTLSGRRWLYVALTRFKKSVKICWY